MSDYIKNNFLPEDHKEAESELNCYDNCLSIARQCIDEDLLDRAIAYLENAKRSQKVLAALRDKHDRAWFIIKQNEADMKMAEMLVNVYARKSN